MIMKIINNSVLSSSLERALNSPFALSKNTAVFISLFLALVFLALEKIFLLLFSFHLKNNQEVL